VTYRRWFSILTLFVVLLPSLQTFGQAEQQAQTSDSQTTQTDASKAAGKKQDAKPAKPQADKGTPPARYYTNKAGQRVQSPTKATTAPEGATAQCRDGSYTFSRSRRGTCSHHGGVASWLTH
jgi:Protein of unknown function (DUF3761)